MAELDVLEETKFLWSGQQETREVCVWMPVV